MQAMGLGASLSSSLGAPPARLQGVDLRLDSFDLSEAKRISPEAQGGSWIGELKCLTECTALGNMFFSSLESGSEVFREEDRSLLNEIYNPKLADRRSEGDLFAPPDTSLSYVTKLRSLVKEEASVRQRRKDHFCSKSFAMEEPGALFPYSWTASFACTARTEQNQRDSLVFRPEYADQTAELLQNVLRDSSPLFDKSTEEGLRFRIYHAGSLEVRTLQEVDREEDVVAVFSITKGLVSSEIRPTAPGLTSNFTTPHMEEKKIAFVQKTSA